MRCTKSGCGKTWSLSGNFPSCNATPCPLREMQEQVQEETSGATVFSTSMDVDVHKEASRHAADIGISFDFIREPFENKIVAYDMKGEQSAATTVFLPDSKTTKDFRTSNQMHSEMRAIEYMLESGHWKMYLGQVYLADGKVVTRKHFKTEQPHCGFCTLFLAVLRLPLGKPTYGQFKLATRLSYPLPEALETDPWFMARVLDSGSYCGFHMIKRVLNGFVNIAANKWILNIKNLAYVNDQHYVPGDPTVIQISWDDLLNQFKREVLWSLWKVIYDALVNNNKEQ